MRIGFTGSHGTGKTVTSDLLRTRPELKDYYCPPSSARALSKAGINTSATPLSQLLVTVDRVTNIASFPDVISDRTAIDSWAYTMHQLNKIWHKDDVPSGYMEITNNYVKQSMRDIDVLVYFPIYWLPKYDGIRSPVHSYQTDIDKLITEGLSRFWQGPVLVMRNEPVEDRVQQVVEYAGLT